MRFLIPRDHWELRLTDFLRGLAAISGLDGGESALWIEGIGECLPLKSGRAALGTAIRALGLSPGAPVAVPLYCCPVVLKAIEGVGCRPLFIDIDPKTFCMSPERLSANRPLFKAIVAVHTFGNLCDMPGLRDAAGGVPIIEDCAQALGSKLDGRPAGSFGDMAFFSFRSGKCISAGEGGALFSTDPELSSRASRLVSTMPNPTRVQEFRHATIAYLKSLFRSRPLYGIAGFHLWRFLDNGVRLSERPKFVLGPIYRADLAVARKRLISLDLSVARQRTHAELLSRALKPEPATICTERPGTFYNRFHFPLVLPSSAQRDRVAALLFEKRIDTIRYLSGLIGTTSRYHGYRGGCPISESMSERVLILPSYHTLTEKEMEYIASVTNEALALLKRRS